MPSRKIAQQLIGRGWNPSPTNFSKACGDTVGANCVRLRAVTDRPYYLSISF